jgi:large-conductance mechanosensitive channel
MTIHYSAFVQSIINKDNFSIVFFLIGLALIVLLQVVKTKLEKKQKTQN